MEEYVQQSWFCLTGMEEKVEVVGLKVDEEFYETWEL